MRTICMGLVVVVTVAVAGAQAPVSTRTLGPVVATSEPLTRVLQVRELADGRVLVNDGGSRQLLLFDSLLRTSKVVLDSTGPQDRRYGSGSLIPYLGDTTLFFDVRALDGNGNRAPRLLVIDGSGNVVRAVPAPTGNGLSGSCVISFGVTTQCKVSARRVDTRGRVVFHVTGSQSGGTDPAMRMTVSSSRFIGYDLARGTVETVFTRSDTSFSAAPRSWPATDRLYPALTEHVELMSDGTIAVVRGQDYHIDWIGADGAVTRSPRIAHEWKILTAADKQRMADSLTLVRDTSNTAQLARIAADTLRHTTPLYDAAGHIVGGFSTAARSVINGRVITPRPLPPPPAESLVPVPADLFPDSLPATTFGALADADNRLWIPLSMFNLTTLPKGTRVFDIVDRSGKLVDRVRVELPHAIVGFGPGGNVYLFERDAAGVGRLQKVRFK